MYWFLEVLMHLLVLGAWCFLTLNIVGEGHCLGPCLNAPYGAWCFLTGIEGDGVLSDPSLVLMRLMALGAF